MALLLLTILNKTEKRGEGVLGPEQLHDSCVELTHTVNGRIRVMYVYLYSLFNGVLKYHMHGLRISSEFSALVR